MNYINIGNFADGCSHRLRGRILSTLVACYLAILWMDFHIADAVDFFGNWWMDAHLIHVFGIEIYHYGSRAIWHFCGRMLTSATR